ncbi:hypothetical protein N7539_000477 [Penicillium diatomitis]|uniref:Uncharacterized protein n=1 Tax=Penicillium diatomitis TaxID=2819901 RepID=A0A9W9XLT9_9EURO|nr:uncharacterized protein N7539_000477 [Penicillium diatomitis]KAJ5495361.1 hypothetical protein N7539_000477 [Penicillium diatomitis]
MIRRDAKVVRQAKLHRTPTKESYEGPGSASQEGNILEYPCGAHAPTWAEGDGGAHEPIRRVRRVQEKARGKAETGKAGECRVGQSFGIRPTPSVLTFTSRGAEGLCVGEEALSHNPFTFWSLESGVWGPTGGHGGGASNLGRACLVAASREPAVLEPDTTFWVSIGLNRWKGPVIQWNPSDSSAPGSGLTEEEFLSFLIRPESAGKVELQAGGREGKVESYTRTGPRRISRKMDRPERLEREEEPVPRTKEVIQSSIQFPFGVIVMGLGRLLPFPGLLGAAGRSHGTKEPRNVSGSWMMNVSLREAAWKSGLQH